LNTSPILWYFADPMCSWCWGFSPVIEAVRDAYRDRMKISLVLGGLRPGTLEPQTPQAREEILHHWHQVHERTGQGFKFEGAMPAGFVYDTEPPSRAVACMADVNPAMIFPMLKAAQSAFYLDNRDITQTAVLAELAVELGMDEGEFLTAFDSVSARHRTQEHFRMSREWGIRGFPTVVLQRNKQLDLITSGWQPLDQIISSIDSSLTV
jgi:putative protein-disulfide isomerase